MAKGMIHILLALSLCGCTYVRVCDERGFAVAGANISYSKWSIAGDFAAGATDADGDLTIWPTLPGIEAITATKAGYYGAFVQAQNRDVIYIILSKDSATRPPLLPQPFTVKPGLDIAP